MAASLYTTKHIFLTTILTGIIAGVLVSGQNCNCPPGLCCSKHGFCGTSNDYCGDGCQGGPCTSGPPAAGGSGVSVADVVTDSYFDGIVNQATGGDCDGKGFYTRSYFLEALKDYPDFGTSGSADDSKREIAAFFAHVTHETGYFCHKEETNRDNSYCDASSTQYPCDPNVKYYGRGPIQLTGNVNYGKAGESLNFDGLRNPDKVASEPVLSFKTALWFWKLVDAKSVMINQGFGQTIHAINPRECGGGDSKAVDARVGLYNSYCNQFKVAPRDNQRC